MKKILLLLLVGGLIVGGCYAKCINSTHNTVKNSTEQYVCVIKNSDSGSFAQVVTSATTTITQCKNCGCDIKMHDDN